MHVDVNFRCPEINKSSIRWTGKHKWLKIGWLLKLKSLYQMVFCVSNSKKKCLARNEYSVQTSYRLLPHNSSFWLSTNSKSKLLFCFKSNWIGFRATSFFSCFNGARLCQQSVCKPKTLALSARPKLQTNVGIGDRRFTMVYYNNTFI